MTPNFTPIIPKTLSLSMGLWEKYQQLSPLSRIGIVFTITLLLVCMIFWTKDWIKKRQLQNKTLITRSAVMEQKKLFYISYWRFVMLALVLTMMLYLVVSRFVNLYKDLPIDYWHNWDRNTMLVLLISIAILFIVFFIVRLLIKGYKAVQFEIGNDFVRFRKTGVKGGMILSDKYVTLKFTEIRQMDFRETPLIGYVLILKTGTETHHVNLLLSTSDKLACYRNLGQAYDSYMEKKR